MIDRRIVTDSGMILTRWTRITCGVFHSNVIPQESEDPEGAARIHVVPRVMHGSDTLSWLYDDFEWPRVPKESMRAGARAIGARLKDHHQIARVGDCQFHPVGEQVERRA
jgi:hypothetical protein